MTEEILLNHITGFYSRIDNDIKKLGYTKEDIKKLKVDIYTFPNNDFPSKYIILFNNKIIKEGE